MSIPTPVAIGLLIALILILGITFRALADITEDVSRLERAVARLRPRAPEPFVPTLRDHTDDLHRWHDGAPASRVDGPPAPDE